MLATIICECGRHSQLLIPGKMLAELLGEDWDQEECNRFNIEMSDRMRFRTEQFVDARQNQIFQCECGVKVPVSVFAEAALPEYMRIMEEERRPPGG